MASLSACWDWKVEPVSPGFNSPEHEADTWCLYDVTPTSPKVEKDDFDQSKTATDLLDELDEWIKEEPLTGWLEEKIDLPLLDTQSPEEESSVYQANQPIYVDTVKPLSPEGKPQQISPQFAVSNDSQSLFQEFDAVFREVELNNGTLTPPQSPTHQPVPEIANPLPVQYSQFPQNVNGNQFLITTFQQMIPIQVQVVAPNPVKYDYISPGLPSPHYEELPPPRFEGLPSPHYEGMPSPHYEEKEQLLPNLEQIVPSPVPDLAEELAAVDELIRTRVEDLEFSSPVPEEQNVWGSENSISTVPSPQNEEITPVDTPESPLSPLSPVSSGGSEDSADDPEWIPPRIEPSSGCQKVTGGRRRSAKPYARVGTEEKRLRKKEQNKNAATRYRQKKKAEVEEILTEEKQLAEENEDLKTKVSDISREIKYLKGLMRDVFKAKGLLK